MRADPEEPRAPSRRPQVPPREGREVAPVGLGAASWGSALVLRCGTQSFRGALELGGHIALEGAVVRGQGSGLRGALVFRSSSSGGPSALPRLGVGVGLGASDLSGLGCGAGRSKPRALLGPLHTHLLGIFAPSRCHLPGVPNCT